MFALWNDTIFLIRLASLNNIDIESAMTNKLDELNKRFSIFARGDKSGV